MKKGLLVAVLITAVIFGAFADTVVEPSVSGNATLTWGVDLDDSTTGFAYGYEGKIELTLVDEATAESTGDGNWGYLKLENYKVAGSSTESEPFVITAPGVAEAKINLGDSMYVKIAGQPDVATNFAAVLDEGDDVSPVATTAAPAGLTLGYSMDMFTIDLIAVSDGDWTTAGNDYAMGTDITITPVADVFKTEVAFVYGNFSGANTGFSVKPTYMMSDLMNGLEAWVGFDGFVANGADFAYDVAMGTTLNFSEANGDDDKSNVALNVYYSDDNLDMTFDVTELSGDEGAMDALGAAVCVDLFDLTSDALVWNVDVTLDYLVNGVKPYTTVGFGSDEVLDLTAGLELGSDFTSIDNTTFTLEYASEDLQTTVDKGLLTFATKISM